MDIVDLAFQAFANDDPEWRPRPANIREYDPLDRVAMGYPPIQATGQLFYTVQYGPGLIDADHPQVTCSESVLSLALALKWREDAKHRPEGEREERLRVVQAAAPAHMTIESMIRRVLHLGLGSFPIYEYLHFTDTYELISGTNRKDMWAIVFIPAEQPLFNANRFPVAHWSFTTVEHHEPPVMVDERPPVVLYSTLPPEPAAKLFWRARVVPANYDVFTRMQSTRSACGCNWSLFCNHEVEFIDAQEQPALRVTFEEDTLIDGTLRAQVVGVINPEFVRLGAHGRVTHVSREGSEIVQMHQHHCSALKVLGVWQKMKRLLQNNDIAASRLAHTVDVAPYRLSLWAYADMAECKQDWFMDTVASAAIGVVGGATGMSEGWQTVSTVEVEEQVMTWAADHDLTLRLPRRKELLARLSLRGILTKDSVMDTVRKIAAEERWDIDVTRQEFRDWLERVVTEEGLAPQPLSLAPDACWNCMQKKKTRWHICRECRKRHALVPLESVALWDTLVAHVGFRPIWSKRFKLPTFKLKEDLVVKRKKWHPCGETSYEVLLSGKGECRFTLSSMLAYLGERESDLTQRGALSGPMFLGLEPTCFPRGESTAVQAFLVRLGAARLNQARECFYDLVFEITKPHLSVIEPESQTEFLSHFTGEKLVKMLDAKQQIDEGWAKPAVIKKGKKRVLVTMSGFPKAEKSNSHSWTKDVYLEQKATEKPRFICAPEPLVLYRLGRYTHAQTKWMAKEFSWDNNLYYAGCANPEDLNSWLNRSLAEIPEPWSLVDDITAIDANHSTESFAYHARVRAIQFPYIEDWVEAAFFGESQVSVKVGSYRCSVADVNASGVSDTSYKNSLICLFIRLVAIAHALFDLTGMSTACAVAIIEEVRREVLISASGDDGLTRMGDFVCGIRVSTNFSIERYREAWGWAGFDVKVALIPPNRWRMATYLAMRPVWSGARYEWAPEPARRMRNMYWQYECPIHPVAWARGISRQVLSQARHVPVIRQLCDWFLSITSGPESKETEHCRAMNHYSSFYGLLSTGDMNERAISEFCLDYHVTREDISLFERVLVTTRDPYVNIDCHVLRRIFEEES